MFLHKRIPSKKYTNYKIDYSIFGSGMNADKDENLLSTKKAKLHYNYDVLSGALKTGIGFKDLTLPKTREPNSLERGIELPENVGFNGVWHFKYYSQTDHRKDHFLIYYGDDSNLYWCKLVSKYSQSFLVNENLSFPTRPNALQYRLNNEDVMIFTEPSSNMMVWPPERDAYVVEGAPKVVSMCLHYERLFAIVEGERVQLRFSDDLNPTNWTTSATEGGYIELLDERGPMNKVLSFGDYLYVFRDFGISRITAFGDQQDFSVSGVHTSSGKIYEGSVTVCGNQILYLSKNGIYSFDGVGATKLNLDIDSLFEGVTNERCSGAYLDNKYYLACKLNFGDGETVGCESGAYSNNALIELDLVSGNLNIVRGVDIVSMTAVSEGYISKLICCFGGDHKNRIGELSHDGAIFGTPLKKAWISPKSDFGYADKKKIIKKISLVTKANMKVKIKTENDTKTLIYGASDKPQTKRPNVVGKQIEISFLVDGASADISKPEIVVGVEN